MKVRLTVELDMPVGLPLVEGYEMSSLGELLSDTYVRYVTVKHSADAMKWLIAAKLGTPEEDIGAKRIYEHHDTWADICAKAKWSFEVDDVAD